MPINDTFLMAEMKVMFSDLLEEGNELNMVCMFVKDYQKKYIGIKEMDPTECEMFTAEAYYKVFDDRRNRYDANRYDAAYTIEKWWLKQRKKMFRKPTKSANKKM